jgi:hypothetical protein
MGVAPLLFLQVLYGHFFYVSSVLMAVYWISIVFILIIAYYSAYVYDFKYISLERWRVLFAGITALLLLAVAFLFTSNLTLMLHPPAWKAWFDRPGGTLLNMADPALIPRYLHFVTASLAVGGLFIAFSARFDGSLDPGGRTRRNRLGLRWFRYATLGQFAVGAWFFMSLPRGVRAPFMGGSGPCALIFGLSILGALASLFLAFRGRTYHTAGFLMAPVVLMAAVRELFGTGFLTFWVTPIRIFGPSYQPFSFLVEAPGAFMALGLMLCLMNLVGKK